MGLLFLRTMRLNLFYAYLLSTDVLPPIFAVPVGINTASLHDIHFVYVWLSPNSTLPFSFLIRTLVTWINNPSKYLFLT